jgi:hypothetical protein
MAPPHVEQPPFPLHIPPFLAPSLLEAFRCHCSALSGRPLHFTSPLLLGGPWLWLLAGVLLVRRREDGLQELGYFFCRENSLEGFLHGVIYYIQYVECIFLVRLNANRASHLLNCTFSPPTQPCPARPPTPPTSVYPTLTATAYPHTPGRPCLPPSSPLPRRSSSQTDAPYTPWQRPSPPLSTPLISLHCSGGGLWLSVHEVRMEGTEAKPTTLRLPPIWV